MHDIWDMLKMMRYWVLLLSLSLSIFLESCGAEVTVLRLSQIIYDHSPKLRIRGSGFIESESNIFLEVNANGQPTLQKDRDYLLTKDADGDGLILKLLANRRWADLTNRVPPVALILSSVKFGYNSQQNLLMEPVIIAQILNMPTVNTNNLTISMSRTNELRINGTGFIGAKSVNFYFNPPLVKEVAYEDVTPYPLRMDQIVLRLRHGYVWRFDTGPLTVIGVDTGGGPVKINGDEGVVVANVIADTTDDATVTVDGTATYQLLYENSTMLRIDGSGFNPIENSLRFSNGLLGNGINYTIIATSTSSMTLSLTPGSVWRKDRQNMPLLLTLLAVNAGKGYVAVGPINSGKGRDIATIYKYPRVYENLSTKLFRTYSHQLLIEGEGFPLPGNTRGDLIQIRSNNGLLVDGTDYNIVLSSESSFKIELITPTAGKGKGWLPQSGILRLTQINVRGDGAGWVTLPGEGIRVAEIVADYDDVDNGSGNNQGNSSGPISIVTSGPSTVYQSALMQSIMVIGTNFPWNPDRIGPSTARIILDPSLKQGVDFEADVQSASTLLLRLKSGKQWRKNAGNLILSSMTSQDGQVFSVQTPNGKSDVVIAKVLANPVIQESNDRYHESQSKILFIQGSGFTNVPDTKISLRPTYPSAFQILGELEDRILVKLKPNQTWLPSFVSLKDETDDKKIAIQISGIDTGAGEIILDEPIRVGYIVKDRIGILCDDSCEFAFDGVCDDSTAPSNHMSNHTSIHRKPRGRSGSTYTYYNAGDDYYTDDSTSGYHVSACAPGTDCTDCGGVDIYTPFSPTQGPASTPSSSQGLCTNTCLYPRDGVCDDTRGTKYCQLGSDCQDCGPVGADNFTRADDDGWWDDDDNDDTSGIDGSDMFGADLNIVAMTNSNDLQFVFDVTLGIGQSVCSASFPKAFRKVSVDTDLPVLSPIAMITQFRTFSNKYPPGSLRFLFTDTNQFYGGCITCDADTGNMGKRVGNWPSDYLKVMNDSNSASVGSIGHTYSNIDGSIRLNSGFSKLCLQNTCVQDPSNVVSPSNSKKHKTPLCGKTHWMGKVLLQGFKSESTADGTNSGDGTLSDRGSNNGGSEGTGIVIGVLLGVGLSFIMLCIYHKYFVVNRDGSGIPGQGEVELQNRALAPMAVVSGTAVTDQQTLNLVNLVQGSVLSVGGAATNSTSSTGVEGSSAVMRKKDEKLESEGLLADETDDGDGDKDDIEKQVPSQEKDAARLEEGTTTKDHEV